MSGPVDRELALRQEDVLSAQTLLDLLAEAQGTQKALDRLEATPGLRLDLRGVIAAHLSDVRTAGYLEGLTVGRREAGQLVLETLRDEGLL